MADYKEFLTEEQKRKNSPYYRGGPADTTNPMGGSIVNALKNEWRALKQDFHKPPPPWADSVREALGKEAGQLAGSPAGQMVGQGLGFVNRQLSKVWGTASTAAEQYGKFFGSPMIERAGKTARDYWHRQAYPERSRTKNIIEAPREMASDLLVPSHGKYKGEKAEGELPAYKRPEAAEVGGDTSVQRGTGATKATEGRSTYAKVAGGTQPLGGVKPMQTPELPDFMTRNKDMKKYQDIAKMSLEDWNKYWSKMPAGERPIHEIRGLNQSWWRPQSGESYETRAGAVTGVKGQPPTMAEIVKNQIEAFKERGHAERQRYASDKGAEATTTAAKIRGEYDVISAEMRANATVRAARAAKKLSSDESWESTKWSDEEGREVLTLHDKKSGRYFHAVPGDVGDVVGYLQLMGRKALPRIAEDLKGAPPETVKEIIDRLPDDYRAMLLEYYESKKTNKK